MAKKSKYIVGPNGENYTRAMLNPQIVKTDDLVRKVVAQAEKLSEHVQKVQGAVTDLVVKHLDGVAEAHGEKWVGNTILKSFDGNYAVEVDIQMQKSYDERLQVAAEKIRHWIDGKLELVTDPGARKVFEQVSQIAKTAMRIDHKGNVDQAKLIQLKKFEFASEPEWVEAMQLISDAERITGTKRYIRFKKANPENGKLETIPVDFSRF